MAFLRSNRPLLSEFRCGKPEALGAVYWEYVGKIERLLREGFGPQDRTTWVPGAHRRPEDLADLVHEVFVRAFSEKARRAYDGLRDYGPYLYAIARNVLADWNRTRARELLGSGGTVDATVDDTTAVEDAPPWTNPAIVRLVESYIAELPPELRALHRLRHEQGLSQEQAANELGVSRQTLRTLERRLRDGLASRLAAAGILVGGQPESSGGRSGKVRLWGNGNQT